MDVNTDNTSNNQCSAAVAYIAFFATLFIISLILNFVVVSLLVAFVYRERKRQYADSDSYHTTSRSRNIYIEGHENMMWSDEVPEYGQEDIDQNDTEENNKIEGEIDTDRIQNIDDSEPVKKKVRFTSV